MQPKKNKEGFVCSFKEQHSTFTSGNQSQHNNQQNIGTIKKTKNKSTLFGCDIIVN